MTQGPIIVLDTETTGFDARQNRVIELTIAELEGGDILFHSYFDPGVILTDFHTQLTGITQEMVSRAPIFAQEASRIAHIIAGAHIVLGYNPQFDRRMLMGEFRRVSEPFKPPRWPPVLCAKRIWDLQEPATKRNLDNAYRRFVDPNGYEGRHGATPDTMATRDVILRQRELWPHLKDVPWHDIDPESKSFWGGTEHVVWREDRLVWNVGKNKNIHVHQVEPSFWKWVAKPDNDFPEHVCVLADYMSYVFHERGSVKTEADLIAWARKKEQEL